MGRFPTLRGSEPKETPYMQLSEIEIDQITLSAQNTRKTQDAGQEDSSLEDLARSIEQKGLLSPITVRKVGSRYELIAGQRRLNACKRLGWHKVPAIVRTDVDDADATAISLIENVHRADMHPLDKARAYQQLSDHYRKNLDRVSRETGVGVATIKKYLSLLDLPAQIQDRISTSEGPAKVDALYALTRTFNDEHEMADVYDQISGFTQPIQKEILKRSGGDIGRIPELVEQAMEGAFDARMCKGLKGRMMCDYIPAELAEVVIDTIEAYRSDDKRSLKDAIRALKEQIL